MKYYFITIILLILLAVAFVSDKLQLIDLSNQRTEIEKILNEKMNLKLLIGGKVIVKFLPIPHIHILDVRLSYEDDVVGVMDELLFYPSFKSYLNGMNNLMQSGENISIKNLYIKNFVVEKYFQDNMQILKNKSDIDCIFNIDKINLNLDSYFESGYVMLVKNSKLNVSSSQVKTSGKVVIQNKTIDYTFALSQQQTGNNIDFTLNDINTQFNLTLNNFDISNLSSMNGKILLNTKYSHNIASRLKNASEKLNNPMQVNDTLNFYADIDCVEDGVVSLENISLQGNIIENPQIDVKFYKVSNDLFEFKVLLSMQKAHIDSSTLKNFKINTFVREYLGIFPTTKNLNINFKLNIDKLMLNEITINALEIKAYNVMGRTIIENFYFKMLDNSEFKASGIVFGNKIRQKFDGVVNLRSNNLDELLNLYIGTESKDNTNNERITLSSNVFAIPNMLKISNTKFRSNTIDCDADIVFQEVPYNAPIKRISLIGKKLNIDKIGVTESLENHFQRLYDADSDKTGEQYFKVTNADAWLRNLNKTLHLDANLEQFIFRQQNIKNVSLLLEMIPNVFDIKSIKVQDERIQGDMSFKFVLPVLRPQITANANLDKLDIDFLKTLLKSKTNDDFTNFLSANSYDGNLELNIKELISNNQSIARDINTNISLILGYIMLKNFKASIWNGETKANGTMLISSYNPVFNFNFNLNSIDPKTMFNDVFGIEKMSGYLSIAGRINGSLKKLSEIYKINGEVDFAGAAIEWNGFSINKAIEALDGAYTLESKLNALDYYMKYGTTFFDTIKGSMKIQKGVVSMSNASLQNKRFTGVYSMNYDLISKTINGAGAFAFIPANQTESLIIQTKTSGSLANPQTSAVDYTKVVEFLKTPSKSE